MWIPKNTCVEKLLDYELGGVFIGNLNVVGKLNPPPIYEKFVEREKNG
jgi:hypothetical protein